MNYHYNVAIQDSLNVNVLKNPAARGISLPRIEKKDKKLPIVYG